MYIIGAALLLFSSTLLLFSASQQYIQPLFFPAAIVMDDSWLLSKLLSKFCVEYVFDASGDILMYALCSIAGPSYF